MQSPLNVTKFCVISGLGSHFGSLVMTPHGVLFNNMLANIADARASAAGQDRLEATNSDQVTNNKGLNASVPAEDAIATQLTDTDPQRKGQKLRVMTPYAPFIVVDSESVRLKTGFRACLL